MRHVVMGFFVVVCSLAMTFSDTFSRPCDQVELSVHKMMGDKEQCFRPDPHPLAYGISYPTGDRLAHNYIYVINMTGKTIQFYTVAYEEDSNGPVATPDFKLPSGTYAWLPLPGGDDYAVGLGQQRIDIAGNIDYLTKEGPTLYKFYTILLQDTTLVVRQVTENEAVSLMKTMQYYRQ